MSSGEEGKSFFRHAAVHKFFCRAQSFETMLRYGVLILGEKYQAAEASVKSYRFCHAPAYLATGGSDQIYNLMKAVPAFFVQRDQYELWRRRGSGRGYSNAIGGTLS